MAGANSGHFDSVIKAYWFRSYWQSCIWPALFLNIVPG